MMSESFAAEARRHFEFLRDEYGYELASESSSQVEWVSRTARIVLTHDPYSYELELEVRPRAFSRAGFVRLVRGDARFGFTLADVAVWRGDQAALTRLPVIAAGPDSLHTGIAELAAVARRVAKPVFQADSRVFQELDRQMRRRGAAETRRFSGPDAR